VHGGGGGREGGVIGRGKKMKGNEGIKGEEENNIIEKSKAKEKKKEGGDTKK
jgi:hypothetical protein